MENNKVLNNIDNDYKSNKAMAREAKRKNKDTSPDIKNMKGVKINRTTIVFPRTQERLNQLLKENDNTTKSREA